MSTPLRRALIGGAIGLVVLVLLRTFVVGVYTVPSASMAPTLVAGDWLLVNHLSRRVERGDVIVFELRGETFVKRALGLPGDRITEDNGQLTINGTRLRTVFLRDANLDDDGLPVSQPAGMASYSLLDELFRGRHWRIARFRGAPSLSRSWVVPPGRLFVVGDNRDGSLDSRTKAFGFVPESSVSGKAVRVLWSSGRTGMRPGRWFLALGGN